MFGLDPLAVLDSTAADMEIRIACADAAAEMSKQEGVTGGS